MKVSLKVIWAGVAAGAAIAVTAWSVKHLMALISRMATSGYSADRANWWMLLLGMASIMVSGLIVRKIVRMPLDDATARLKADIAAGKALLPSRLMVAPVAVNAITLGLGGSAGAEGPIAYSGAAIASRIASRLRLPSDVALAFMACGAGAGIAAIFKAPLGGVFFTIEVLGFSLSSGGVILLTIMCLTAGLGAYALGGFTPDMAFDTAVPFTLRWYLPALLAGIVCGLYSRYYDSCGQAIRRRLKAISNPWRRNLIAGSALGVMLLMFPSLYGEGYQVLGKALNGDTAIMAEGTLVHGLGGAALIAAVLAGIIIVKPMATYVTNSGGGVAGDFAPTIFAGGMVGALFAIGAGCLPEWSAMPRGDFMLISMAAVMAGTIKAPLMAIFIVTEMTQSPQLLLPAGIASYASYAIARFGKFSKTKS